MKRSRTAPVIDSPERQLHRHDRARAGTALEPETPPRPLHELPREVEPQARPHGAGGEERLPEPGEHVGRDPRPVVRDADRDALRPPRAAYAHAATLRDRLERALHRSEEHTSELQSPY